MYLWGNNWRGDELLHFLLQFKFNSSHSLITQLLLGQDLGVTVGPTQVYKHTQSHIYSLHWGNSWWQWEFTYIWYIYSCSDVAAVFFLHVICEFVVKGFDVALATLQLLLKLAQVIVQLIQLTYSTDTQNNKSYIINELFYFFILRIWLAVNATDFSDMEVKCQICHLWVPVWFWCWRKCSAAACPGRKNTTSFNFHSVCQLFIFLKCEPGRKRSKRCFHCLQIAQHDMCHLFPVLFYVVYLLLVAVVLGTFQLSLVEGLYVV